MDDPPLIELLGRIVLFGLISPLTAVPAFLYGMVVRRWWLVPVGAVGLAAIFAALGFEEGEVVWLAAPVAVVPPLAWAAAGYYVGRWRRARPGGVPATLARGASIVAGLVLGAVAGAVAGFAIGMAYVELAQVSSFEGLAGYVVVFLFALPGLVVGAILGAVIGGMIRRRLDARQASPA
jgi:hypothetical protein